MSTHEDRLRAMRETLAGDRLDGFVVPLTDEHMSEYVGSYAQRLAWLTGFEGSAGAAAVLAREAAIFTDGRYTIQVREQVDGNLFSYQGLPKVQVADWLAEKVGAGQRIGYDPWLHTRGWVRDTAAKLAANGAELVPVDTNPVDRIWTGRPAPSKDKLQVHGEEMSGRSSADKRREIAEWLTKKKAGAVVIAALDSIAWLFNIRGSDVSRTPVALAFAIVFADGRAELFTDLGKVTDEVRAHLGTDVAVRPRTEFTAALAALGAGGEPVVVDPGTAVAAIFQALEDAGAKIIEARDPCILAKAVKNETEVEGSRAAHRRDGAALTRFLAWFDAEAPKGELSEMSAAHKLEAIRKESNLLRDLSFDTISGAGPNAAIPHYRVSEESSRPVEMDRIYLVDSGGQYPDGTTDVTRTMIVGTPTPEMRDRFTRVLKGHIALARAVFPEGTRGSQLDALARQFLWEAGLDYAHGTGHGVGSYLSVHEGPQRIATFGGGDEPLKAGMILSDEPGYYKSGEYGIRIENLVLVTPVEIEGAEQPMLGFETLTLAPIDLRLIETSMLTEAEKTWLNDYHARVREEMGRLVPDDVRPWLEEATRPV
jgi:Xaa-Pro aminopeptidase